ncbi:MAG: exodeoxyribonuclease VII large subunit [Bdellovibrionales bacterium]
MTREQGMNFLNQPISDEEETLSVSDLNRQIKQNLESEFPLVWVKGELSNFTSHRSGHWYFSLKDSGSQISAVMFKGHNSRLKFEPKAGDEVIVRARISVYEPRGSYQLACELMEPVGAGALQKEFEQLKKKLSDEGLFDPTNKKKLPQYPKRIAVVTSPTGAAIKDILNVLNRRYKGVEVFVVPCKVQGDQAIKEIVKAIELVKEFSSSFDAMIVGRGGGSIEDLWCFNDELVARSIFSSPIPVISAVGHEIDFTIADFVADVRAPTPSAAAELVVKNGEELLQKLNDNKKRLWRSIRSKIELEGSFLKGLERGLGSPIRKIEAKQQRVDELMSKLESLELRRIDKLKSSVRVLSAKLISPEQGIEKDRLRLYGSMEKLRSLVNLKLKDDGRAVEPLLARLEVVVKRQIQKKKHDFGLSVGKLESLSPLKVLDRGYSIVELDSEVIKSARDVKIKDVINIRLSRGRVSAEILAVEGD